MQEIKIPQTGLPPREILLEDRGQTITLHDNYIHIQSSGKWKLPKDDDDKITTTSFFDNSFIFDKKGFWTIEMYYHNESKRYIVDIGSAKICFGTDDENPKFARVRCKELFDKIAKWKYGI